MTTVLSLMPETVMTTLSLAPQLVIECVAIDSISYQFLVLPQRILPSADPLLFMVVDSPCMLEDIAPELSSVRLLPSYQSW